MRTVLGRTAVGLAIALSAAAANACGGATFSSSPGDAGNQGDSGAGNDSATPVDSGAPPTDSGTPVTDSGGGSPVDSPVPPPPPPGDATVPPSDAGGPTSCPASAPTAGMSCAANGTECEYGTNPNPDCNDVYQCTSGFWVKEALVGCVAGTCPSSYASVPTNPNQTCQPDNLTCSYPQGTCICSEGSLPRVGGPSWMCFPAQTGCPSPRPDYGTSCAAEGQTCDYGACNGGVEVECTNGTWQEDPMVACPAVR